LGRQTLLIVNGNGLAKKNGLGNREGGLTLSKYRRGSSFARNGFATGGGGTEKKKGKYTLADGVEPVSSIIVGEAGLRDDSKRGG